MESKHRSKRRSPSGSTEKNKRARDLANRPQCPPVPYLQFLTNNFHRPEKILLLLNFSLLLRFGLSSPPVFLLSPLSPRHTVLAAPASSSSRQPTLTPTLLWKRQVHVHQPLLQPPHRPGISKSHPVHNCSLVFALEIGWKWKSDSVSKRSPYEFKFIFIENWRGPWQVSDLGVQGDFHQQLQQGIKGAEKRDIKFCEGSIHPARNYRHKITLSQLS